MLRIDNQRARSIQPIFGTGVGGGTNGFLRPVETLLQHGERGGIRFQGRGLIKQSFQPANLGDAREAVRLETHRPRG